MPDLCRWVLLCVLLWPAALLGAEPGTWADYKARFLSPDGRIIDDGRRGISHSEGQGYGLMLALINDDRASFETIRRWTFDNLHVRKDGLFAWSWGERSDGQWAVIDYNNATDGDLLIGSALVEAGTRWQRDDYRDQGWAIAEAIQGNLAIREAGQILLLPGYYGFRSSAGVVINPGYFVFPAYRTFAGGPQGPFWSAVEKDAVAVLQASRNGTLQLPPDWLLLTDGRWAVFEERSTDFGYEAIRIPLYLALAGLQRPAEAFRPLLTWVERHGYLPNEIDLVQGRVSLAEAPAGFYAVAGRCAALLGDSALGRDLFARADRLLRQTPQPYYAYTLYLLARKGAWP